MKELLTTQLFDKLCENDLEITIEDRIIENENEFYRLVSITPYLTSFALKRKNKWEIELQIFGEICNIGRALLLISKTIEESDLCFKNTNLYFKYQVKYSI